MFLLILEEEYKEYHALNFTFHYVSINTCRVFCIASTTSFFTFHYVSINTMCIWILPDGYRTLHSTMFLLIQTASQISELMKAALHSTMFLLIRQFLTQSVRIENLYIPLCFY